MSKKRVIEEAKTAANAADLPSSVEEARAAEERTVHEEEMKVSIGEQLESEHEDAAIKALYLKDELPEGEPAASSVYKEALDEIEHVEEPHVEARTVHAPPSSRARERHLHEKRQPRVDEPAKNDDAEVRPLRARRGPIRRIRTQSKLAVRELKIGVRRAVKELYLGVRRAAETLATS
jgi:hypothetical protein